MSDAHIPAKAKSPGDISAFRKAVRRAVADYMRSEGCNCCRDQEAHTENEKRLAKLLGVARYSDGSGYNFPRWRSK